MNLFSSQNLIQMLYMLIPIILALSVHEFAHAFVADKWAILLQGFLEE